MLKKSTTSIPSILLISYVIALSFYVFKSSILINLLLTLIHYSIFIYAHKKHSKITKITSALQLPKPAIVFPRRMHKGQSNPVSKIVLQLKKTTPLFLIIIFTSAFFSGGSNIVFSFIIFSQQIAFTIEGLSIGIAAVSAYLSLISAASLFQIKKINDSFIKIASKYQFFAPLILAYTFIFSQTKHQKDSISTSEGSIFKRKIEQNIQLIKAFIEKEGIQDTHHNAIYISSVAVLLTSLRALKVLPGIPVAPGHKLLITLPLYYFIAATLGGWSATITALTFGMLSLLLGLFGQMALMDFIRVICLGVLVDISAKLLPSQKYARLILLIIYGVIQGLVFAYLGVIFFILLDVPKALYILSAHKFLFSAIFGGISGSISYYLIRPTKK